jgi:hypothetical protein
VLRFYKNKNSDRDDTCVMRIWPIKRSNETFQRIALHYLANLKHTSGNKDIMCQFKCHDEKRGI